MDFPYLFRRNNKKFLVFLVDILGGRGVMIKFYQDLGENFPRDKKVSGENK